MTSKTKAYHWETSWLAVKSQIYSSLFDEILSIPYTLLIINSMLKHKMNIYLFFMINYYIKRKKSKINNDLAILLDKNSIYFAKISRH